MKSSVPGVSAVSNNAIRPEHKTLRGVLTRRLIWSGYICSLLISDAIMTLIAFRLAYYFRFELDLTFFRLDAPAALPFYSSLSYVLLIAWLTIFAIVGLYKKENLMGGTEEYALVGRATTMGMMVLIVAGFLQPAFIIARGWVLMAWLFSLVLIDLGRFVLRRVVYMLRRKGLFLAKTIIVGANDEGLSLARQLKAWNTSGLDVIGFVDKKCKPGTLLFGNMRVLGDMEHLEDVIQGYGVEELVLASSAISSHDKMLEIFQRYGVNSGVNVRMSSGLYEIITTGLTVKEFAYVPLVGVNKVRLTGLDTFIKFVADLIITIPAMILLLPILLIIGIAIKLDSPGPILHRRRVMGVNKRQFDALKFRTMYVDGDNIIEKYPGLKADLARNHKLKDDPRVTRVGRFLRKWSLDELPQLINVLLGQMSLVGPRMISPIEAAEYGPMQPNLLTVKPGITGLWQVSGRSDLTYRERVRLDMEYVRNYSIWLDIQILFFQTLPAVVKGHGAY
jgi:exopolysaccharide biosynthesis polyprenyl glycosylphosphotransferase